MVSTSSSRDVSGTITGMGFHHRQSYYHTGSVWWPLLFISYHGSRPITWPFLMKITSYAGRKMPWTPLTHGIRFERSSAVAVVLLRSGTKRSARGNLDLCRGMACAAARHDWLTPPRLLPGTMRAIDGFAACSRPFRPDLPRQVSRFSAFGPPRACRSVHKKTADAFSNVSRGLWGSDLWTLQA